MFDLFAKQIKKLFPIFNNKTINYKSQLIENKYCNINLIKITISIVYNLSGFYYNNYCSYSYVYFFYFYMIR
jgi:hypothetical protein